MVAGRLRRIGGGERGNSTVPVASEILSSRLARFTPIA
jgi:hypothetical protein